MFGREINVNFDKYGNVKKSQCGGFISVITIIVILAYSIYRCYVMFKCDQTSMSSFSQHIDPK